MSDLLTADEVMESMTGFDEIAVARAFDGRELLTLAESHPLTFMRALVFVLKRRDGLSDVDAKESALSLTVRQVHDSFASGDDTAGDVFEDEPVSVSGKDG